MKLRQKPEDFIVEEITNVDIRKEGEYKIYQIEKRSIETYFLIRHLSNKFNIPTEKIGFAGLKDKHSISTQYISIHKEYDIKDFEEQNIKFKFVGYSNSQIKVGDLIGNKFIITVRDVNKREINEVYSRAKEITNGVPNYFDSQRFGSVQDNRFIIKEIMKKNYDGALEIFLTSITGFEDKNKKKDMREISKNWKDLSKAKIKDKLLSSIVKEYLKKGDWLSAYNKIPRNLRELFVSSYQSYLWNECVKELIKSIIHENKLFRVKYNVGRFLFFSEINKEEINKLDRKFQLITHKSEFDPVEKEMGNIVLKREGIKIEQFDIKKETDTFFGENKREIIVKPSNFEMSQPENDELNDNRSKIILKFELPKGSYATIITKSIFGK